MPCELCRTKPQDWSGDPPTCAFRSGAFSANNWNCFTANLIREIVYEGQETIPEVDYRYCSDQKYATICLDSFDWLDDQPAPIAMWVCWYKNRGKTDAMWLLFEGQPPRAPTEAECLHVHGLFKAELEARA